MQSQQLDIFRGYRLKESVHSERIEVVLTAIDKIFQLLVVGDSIFKLVKKLIVCFLQVYSAK